MFVSGLQTTMLGLDALAYFGQVEPVREHARFISVAEPRRRRHRRTPALPRPGTLRGDRLGFRSGSETPPSENLLRRDRGRDQESSRRCTARFWPIRRSSDGGSTRVRARYLALLKRAGHDPAVEEAIRVRLARITRHEQAAEAARTIQTILAAEPSPRPGGRPGEAPNRGGGTIPSPRLQRRGLHAALRPEDRRPEALRLDCQERIDRRLPRHSSRARPRSSGRPPRGRSRRPSL